MAMLCALRFEKPKMRKNVQTDQISLITIRYLEKVFKENENIFGNLNNKATFALPVTVR
jgi:hypothetical protein